MQKAPAWQCSKLARDHTATRCWNAPRPVCGLHGCKALSNAYSVATITPRSHIISDMHKARESHAGSHTWQADHFNLRVSGYHTCCWEVTSDNRPPVRPSSMNGDQDHQQSIARTECPTVCLRYMHGRCIAIESMRQQTDQQTTGTTTDARIACDVKTIHLAFSPLSHISYSVRDCCATAQQQDPVAAQGPTNASMTPQYP